MSEAELREWQDSPLTKTLLLCLRQRKAAILQTFLAGQPLDLVAQGRASALHEIELLLTKPAADVKKVFETALRESDKK